MKKLFSVLIALVLVASFSLVTAVPATAADPNPLSGYEIVTSPEMSFGDGGWGGWSVPAGKVVLGGGFYATAPVAASAPGTPDSVWPHYTYGSDEYGWCVRDAPDGVPNTITIYAICADEPAGYGVVTSVSLNYGDGGWAGWSVPAGKVVLGGGFNLTGGPAAVSAPGTPNSVWAHYTYGSDEYGWCVRDAQDGASSPGSTVYAIYADEPAGYGVVTSASLNYGDGGWAGWSVPAGKVVLGGGFNLTGGPAAVSAPGTPNSVWAHYTYGPHEYGWCVRDAQDGASSPGSTVYAIYASLTEVWVDDDWVALDLGEAADGHTFGYDAFAVIQDGIDTVAEAGTVNVAAGTYDPFTVDESLTLLGAQANEEPIVDGVVRSGDESIIYAPYPENYAGIEILADDVIVNGFEIVNGYHSIACNIERGLHQNVQILYNYIHSNKAWGGINLMERGGDGSPVTFRNFAISHNYVNLEAPYPGKANTHGAVGMSGGGSSFATYDQLEISYNTLYNPYGHGIFCGAGLENFEVVNPVIKWNKIYNCSMAGINIVNMANVEISDNLLDGTAYGINIAAEGGIIAKNTIRNTLPAHPMWGGGPSYGLYLLGDMASWIDPPTALVHGSQDLEVIDNDFYFNSAPDTYGATVESSADANTIEFHYNSFFDGAAVDGVLALKNDVTGVGLNAEKNWWGHASGPQPPGTYESYGGKVSADVDFEPWLLEAGGVTYDKTLALKDKWTLISTDKLVATTGSTWVGTNDLSPEDPLTVITVLAYEYTGVSYPVVELPDGLKPIDALYVKTAGGGGVGINYSDSAPGLSSKELVAGWNLISSGTIADAGGVLSPLRDIATEGTGLTTLVSQGSYNQHTEGWYVDATTWEKLSGDMNPFDGYWIYMNAAKSFGVISD